jgi:hypothetical protein
VVSVRAPSSVPRAGDGPRFEIAAATDRFTALEVATEPRLFSAHERTAADDAGAFYGSWAEGRLRPAGTFEIPGAAWTALRVSDSLFYRALASGSPDAWVDVETTVPEGSSPSPPFLAILDVATPGGTPPVDLDRVWRAALVHADVAELARQRDASGVLVRHVSSPRRPITPRAIDWVVVVAVPGAGAVDEVVVHVSEPNLDVSAASRTQLAAKPTTEDDAHSAAEAVATAADDDPGSEGALGAGPKSFERAGPAWLWQEPAPPPAEATGGTVLVSALTGRLLFAATTSWQGGRVLVA